MCWWGPRHWLHSPDTELDDRESAMDGLKTLKTLPAPAKESSTRPSSSGKLLQLTPLWEQVVKNQRVPPEVDVDTVFAEVGVRLHDPEWQVRQHALRVLVDVIPVLHPSGGDLDRLMAPVVLPELVANLGHSAPAVRKGALDTLRVYLAHAADPEAVLRAIVTCGLEKPVHANVPMGVILCIPSLLFPLVAPHTGVIISQQGLVHLVSALSKRLVQVAYQEQALRTMVKIRDMVGDHRFDRFLEGFHPQCKRDFDILCQVYEVRSSLGDSGIDLQIIPAEEEGSGYWSDESSPPVPTSSCTPPSEDSLYRDQNQNDITKSTPIEMVLHPIQDEPQDNSNQGTESTKTEIGDDQHSDLDDEDDEEFESDKDTSTEGKDEELSEEYEAYGAKPPKEEEGTNIPPKPEVSPVSEEEVTQENKTGEEVATEKELPSGRVILETEIKFSEETAITMTILEENEPRGQPGEDNQQYHGFIMKVLTDDEYYNDDDDVEIPEEPPRRTPRRVRFGGEMVMLRTPDSDAASEFQDYDVLRIEGDDPQSVEDPVETVPSVDPEVAIEESVKSAGTFQSQIPIPIVPALHRPKVSQEKGPVFSRQVKPPSDASSDGHSVASETCKEVAIPEMATLPRIVDESIQKSSTSPSLGTSASTTDESKVVDDSDCNTSSSDVSAATKAPPEVQVEAASDSPVPTIDGGESLTCSSSEGEQLALVTQDTVGGIRSWEDLGIVSREVADDLRNKEDWRVRIRALDELTAALQTPGTPARLGPCLPSLLHLLLVSLAEDRSHRVATSALGAVRGLVGTLPAAWLRQHLGQLAAGLARRVGGGGSVSVRVEAVQAVRALMQRLGAAVVLDVLLAPPCVGSRSSKLRESSLLCVVYAAMTFPSSQFDAQKTLCRVMPSVGDARRRVRQAALDAVAVLAQFVPPPTLLPPLRAAAEAQGSPAARDALLAAVRARLARRQLPALSQDGLLLYALQIPASRGQTQPGQPQGEDVDWILGGSGSLSSGSAKSRGQLHTVARGASPPALDTRGGIRASNPWTDRRSQEFVAVGVGVPTAASRGGQQLTWALVPVSSLPDEQRPRGSSPWATDLADSTASALAASHGSLRPLYLRLQNGTDEVNGAVDRGFSLLPSKLPPARAASEGALLEKMNQSWPPPSPAFGNPPRVLTPTQHRGRRILEPIGGGQGAAADEPFTRRATPVQTRAGPPDTPSRHRIPPLTSAGRPQQPRPAFQDTTEDASDDGLVQRAAAAAKPRVDKNRPRRRYRSRAVREPPPEVASEDVLRVDSHSYAGLHRRS